jgi:hypothetical protein
MWSSGLCLAGGNVLVALYKAITGCYFNPEGGDSKFLQNLVNYATFTWRFYPEDSTVNVQCNHQVMEFTIEDGCLLSCCTM